MNWALDWHWMRRRRSTEEAEEENEAAAVAVAAERWPVENMKVNDKDQNDIWTSTKEE